MKNEITAYNPFEYLETAEERRVFINSCFDNDNPFVLLDCLVDAINFFGVSKIAKIAGLNRDNLYKIINENRKPALLTAHAIKRAICSPELDGFEPSKREEKEPVTT